MTLFTLKNKQISMSISSQGGRIMSFKYQDQESLVQEGIQIGSTFWPAPQELWGWPPPKELDEGEYEVVENKENKIVLLSPLDEQLNIQVEKTLTAQDSDILVTYKIINRSQKPVKMAAWEISRLVGGVTFYESTDQLEPQSTLAVEQINGHQWYDYQQSLLTEEVPKIFANGSQGWLANANNGLLMIKSFDKVSKKEVAPGESEVEIYAHSDSDDLYIEIEQQSAFVEIQGNSSYSWPVKWSLLPINQDVKQQAGNMKLVELVSSHLKL